MQIFSKTWRQNIKIFSEHDLQKSRSSEATGVGTWEVGKLLSYDQNSIVGDIRNPFYCAEEPEVHLWILRCHADPQQIYQMEALLSPTELIRSSTFHFKRDSRRYICAHGKLRLTLSNYTGQSPKDIEFSTGPHGKPFIKNYDGILFNLSHTGDLIAIAVAADTDVGVDIERCCSLANATDISKKIMTTDEYRHFMTLKASDQTSFFYKCWVRKEAAVKAWGTGIDDNLCGIPILEEGLSSTHKKITTYDGNEQQTWIIADIELGCDHTGAVCFRYQKRNKTLRFARLDKSAQHSTAPSQFSCAL